MRRRLRSADGAVSPQSRSLVAGVGISAASVMLFGVGIAFTRQTDTTPSVPSTTTTTVPATTTSTAPQPTVPVSTPLATPQGDIRTFDAPAGREIGSVGTWYGYSMTMPIVEEVPGWVRLMLPERPNGSTAWVRAEQVTRSTAPWRLVVTLSDFRVRVYRDGYEQWSSALGIGKDSTRTPTGNYFVAVIEKPGAPGYGSVVLDLNAHSEDIKSWKGSGDAITAFHGPFGAEALLRAGGGKVSNGCMRMLPEDQIKLDAIPIGTPVDILP